MRLRLATLADVELILAWRNDPASIAASRRMRPLTKAEIGGYLSGGFIAEQDGASVGIVRIEPISEVSWMVAPEARRNGVGRSMLWAAVEQEGRKVAFIKPDNFASQKIAAAAGFARVDGLETWIRG